MSVDCWLLLNAKDYSQIDIYEYIHFVCNLQALFKETIYDQFLKSAPALRYGKFGIIFIILGFCLISIFSIYLYHLFNVRKLQYESH